MQIPMVVVLDPDAESRKNILFLLELVKFGVRSFADEKECLNWLAIMKDESSEVLSIVINGGLERDAIKGFFSSLDKTEFSAPVLIVDRFKYTVNKNELMKGVYTPLPIYVCDNSEIVVMLRHFSVLRTNLDAKHRSFKSLFQN
jgi:hypothetical protein